jgi:hypothetical protein
MGDLGSISNVVEHVSAALRDKSTDSITFSNLILAIASAISTMLSVVVATAALVISGKAVTEEARSERLSRNLEALLYCQSAYKSVEAIRLAYLYENNEEKRISAQNQEASLLRSFWTLKSDQFDYWLSGYIDYDTFLSWSISTGRHFTMQKGNFLVHSFGHGWANHGRPYNEGINPLFVRFTDALQWYFSQRIEVDAESIYKVLDMMKELDDLNRKWWMFDTNKRRLGAPQKLGEYRSDLVRLNKNMKSLLSSSLPPNYDMAGYGKLLLSEYPA